MCVFRRIKKRTKTFLETTIRQRKTNKITRRSTMKNSLISAGKKK